MPAFIDMTGVKCGHLTVIDLHSRRSDGGQAQWKCICSCGTEKVVNGRDLRDGNVKSCGCRMKIEKKICTQCGVEKELLHFGFSAQKQAYKPVCRDCNARKIVQTTPSRGRYRVRNKIKNTEIRTRALNHYGAKCTCCGEETKIFLAFDHINGGGNQHRGDLRRRKFATIAMWLEANGYPSDFQVLCNNCNWAKHANEICPHQIDSAVSALSMGG